MLSKSDFLKYRVCPSYFWVHKHRTELIPEPTATEVRDSKFEQGNKVEALARHLSPDGQLIAGYNTIAAERTKQVVSSGASVLFQATVITESGLLAMADVLEKTEDGWILYEIKSSTEVKKDLHIPDLAFQKIAFVSEGYPIIATKIIHLDKEFRRHGEPIDPEELFATEDVTYMVKKIEGEAQVQIGSCLNLLASNTEPTTCPCRYLTRANHCPLFSHFNPDIPAYSIYDVSRISARRIEELIDNNILLTTDIPDDFPLTPNQKIQVERDKDSQIHIDHAAIKNELDGLEYPLYFIDYESVNPAIPLYEGMKPFQQSVFQYSLHIKDAPESKLRHTEYLSHDTKRESMRGLIVQMRHDIGDTGTIIVWNKSFEASRNKEMAELFPEYADFLLDTNDRMYDLLLIFRRNLYVDARFHGSNSIKDVLPILVPELSYKELNIGKGDLAAVRWFEAVTEADSETAEQTFNDLLEYCGLDTFAMVRIWEELAKV